MDVIKQIESNPPASFEEALGFTRTQMRKAREFIITQDLATIPENDALFVNETPAFLAPLVPFAALFPPAKFDPRQIGNYIVTRPKAPQNLGKHLNYADIPGTAVREGYPGHYLQTLVSNQKGLFSVLAGAPEMVEGWHTFVNK